MDGPKAVVKASAFVEEGPGVAALGIPVSDLLDEYEELREEVSTISRRARESLQRHGLADSQDAVEELAAFVAGIVRGELEERLKTKGKPV